MNSPCTPEFASMYIYCAKMQGSSLCLEINMAASSCVDDEFEKAGANTLFDTGKKSCTIMV